MKTAIVAIGDEITSGLKTDTNSGWLAARLGEIGISVSGVFAVGDRLGDVVDLLRQVARDYQLVLATGGLGPTHDDITRQALAEAFERPLVLDRATQTRIEERFRSRGLAAPEAIAALAMVPRGAVVIPNPAGTAPGLLVRHGEARVYVFPGVPQEVEAIFRAGVLDGLAGLAPARFIKTRIVKTVGITESAIADRLRPVLSRIKVRLAYLPEDIGVRLTLTAESDDQSRALASLEEAVATVVGAVGDRVYSTAGEELHDVVAAALLRSGRTIAVAESCTGGLVAHLLTEVPGISAVLERAVVAYSNRAKTDALGVAADLITRHGAVSGEVAEAMAVGVRRRAGTDLGLATTGIAGPSGGSPSKPVGLVYTALASGERCRVAEHRLAGDRGLVKRRAAARALDMVRSSLAGPAGEDRPRGKERDERPVR
ncbi:MAG: CinA family nicotinamide mononucleotide deamidase-related protein [bacterium]